MLREGLDLPEVSLIAIMDADKEGFLRSTTSLIVLVAHGLHKRAGGQPVLRGASLRVQSGETVAITGASGAGKSTLARVLAGLLRPDAGTVEMPGLARDGASGPACNGKGGLGGLAFVPQHAAASVAPHFSVFEAVVEPLAIEGRLDAAALQAAPGSITGKIKRKKYLS